MTVQRHNNFYQTRSLSSIFAPMLDTRVFYWGMEMEIQHEKIDIEAKNMSETELSHRVVNAKGDDRESLYGVRIIGSAVRIRQPIAHKEFEVMP